MLAWLFPSVSAWINVLMLGLILKKKLNYPFDISVLRVFIKVLISSIFMAYFVLEIYKYTYMNFTYNNFFGKDLSLIMCIISGIVIYASFLYFIGRKELELEKWKKKKNLS